DSGFAAIKKIESGNVYDIVFMDHMMPKMDGVETTKIIRSKGYNHPIVALTANAVAGQADIFRKNGFDDFISKPIDIRQLNTVLNKLIRDKQPPEVIEAANKQADFKKAQTADSVSETEITEFFIQDALRSLRVLEEISAKNGYSDEDDLQAYIINVHGMKSALANIGKMDLSAVALKLEAAGREGKYDMITEKTPAFLASLRAYVDELKQNSQKVFIDPADEDKQYLHEKLLVIKAACEEYDDEAADETLAELREKEWSQQTGEMLGSISEFLLHSAFEKVIRVIDDNC
ncbi:MAG: response regulator, partial [Oscillospiraceae bacterium]|nr:response regulator [Oscillospiraceae bacterium]